METLIIGLVVVCLVSQWIVFFTVGRFIDLISEMHKREYRKNNSK